MTLIVDTGGLLSVLDDKQDDHELFLDAVRSTRSPLLLSPLVLTELDHLILDRYGRQAELSAIEEVEAAYQVDRIDNEDLARAYTLLSRYADLTTFDLADALCVVLAERYECFTSSPPISATSAPSPDVTGNFFASYPTICSEVRQRSKAQDTLRAEIL